jgi:hypothetical protein
VFEVDESLTCFVLIGAVVDVHEMAVWIRLEWG